MPEPLQVTAAEAGQKLLQFLSRRFEEPQSVLHRWIRTGQVRINGGRAKPFDRVELNDEIRVPPFAGAGMKAERAPASSGGKELPPSLRRRMMSSCSASRPACPYIRARDIRTA